MQREIIVVILSVIIFSGISFWYHAQHAFETVSYKPIAKTFSFPTNPPFFSQK